MLDLATCFALVSACSRETRFVFVGDRDQLPPVGPGAVFSDLLRMSEADVPRTVLKARGGAGGARSLHLPGDFSVCI